MSTLKKFPLEAIFNRHRLSLPAATLDLLNDLMRFLGERDINLSSLLNQGLRIPDNFDGALLTFTTNAVADTEDTTAHGLRKVPSYFIPLSSDKGGVLYKSGTAWTATNIYTKCTVATQAVTIFVF